MKTSQKLKDDILKMVIYFTFSESYIMIILYTKVLLKIEEAWKEYT